MLRSFRRSEWWGRASRKWVPAAFFLAALSFGTLSWAAEKVNPSGVENWSAVIMGILAGAAGVIGAITAFLRQMNRARTAARKLQEDQKDSDEFRREEILRRESEERKQIRDRLDALEKSQTAQSGQLEKILKRLGNLPRGF